MAELKAARAFFSSRAFSYALRETPRVSSLICTTLSLLARRSEDSEMDFSKCAMSCLLRCVFPLRGYPDSRMSWRVRTVVICWVKLAYRHEDM